MSNFEIWGQSEPNWDPELVEPNTDDLPPTQEMLQQIAEISAQRVAAQKQHTQVVRQDLDPTVWDMSRVTQAPQPKAPKRVVVPSANVPYDGSKDFGVHAVRPIQDAEKERLYTEWLEAHNKATRRNMLKAVSSIGGLILIASLTAAGVTVLKNRSTTVSEGTLPPIGTDAASTIITTTELSTTTTVEAQTCISYVVEKGDTLTSIAKKLTDLCGSTLQKSVSITDLMQYNGIANADNIKAGQVLLFSGPVPSTTVVESTVAPTTTAVASTTTVVPTTVPATTIPAPTTTIKPKPNDGVLKDPECAALAGIRHSFNDTFTRYAEVAYAPITATQIAQLYAKIAIPFHLSNIYHDTPGDPYDLAECVPGSRAAAFAIINS